MIKTTYSVIPAFKHQPTRTRVCYLPSSSSLVCYVPQNRQEYPTQEESTHVLHADQHAENFQIAGSPQPFCVSPASFQNESKRNSVENKRGIVQHCFTLSHRMNKEYQKEEESKSTLQQQSTISSCSTY
jgi:hypothetical protein